MYMYKYIYIKVWNIYNTHCASELILRRANKWRRNLREKERERERNAKIEFNRRDFHSLATFEANACAFIEPFYGQVKELWDTFIRVHLYSAGNVGLQQYDNSVACKYGCKWNLLTVAEYLSVSPIAPSVYIPVYCLSHQGHSLSLVRESISKKHTINYAGYKVVQNTNAITRTRRIDIVIYYYDRRENAWHVRLATSSTRSRSRRNNDNFKLVAILRSRFFCIIYKYFSF